MSRDEIKQRVREMSDNQLLDMVEVEFNDYRKEALDLARAELTRRGVEFDDPSAPQISVQDKPDADVAVNEKPVRVCTACAVDMRAGTLVADSELTVIFGDDSEERFVNLFACPKCGRIDLFVDFEVDVQR